MKIDISGYKLCKQGNYFVFDGLLKEDTLDMLAHRMNINVTVLGQI